MTWHPITLDREWLTYDMNVTEADLARLGDIPEQDINRAIENGADDEFWEVASDLRTRVINHLLDTTY